MVNTITDVETATPDMRSPFRRRLDDQVQSEMQQAEQQAQWNTSVQAEDATTLPVEQQTYNQPAPTVEVPVGPPVAVLPPEVVDARARRYNEALPPDRQPGEAALAQRISMGQDGLVRNEYALRQQQEMLARRAETINAYMTNRPSGEPPRADEVTYIQNVASGELARIQSDPTTYFERLRAERNTNSLASRDTPEVVEARAEARFNELNAASTHIQTLQDYAAFRLEGLRAQARARTGSQVAYDIAGSLVSPLQQYRESGLIAPSGAFFLGNNQRDQAEWYYSQRDQQVAIQALDRAVDQLAGQNMNTALDFLGAIVDHSSSTYALNNFFSFLDVAPGIGFIPYKLAAGGALYALGKAGTRGAYETALHDVQVAARNNRNYPNPAPVLEAGGNIPDAAAYVAREQALGDANRTAQVAAVDGLQGMGRALWNTDSVVPLTGTRLSNEAAQRLRVGLNEQAEMMVDSFMNRSPRIQVLTPGSPTERVAAEEARRIALNHQYNHIADRVLDISRTVPPSIDELPRVLRDPAFAAVTAEQQIVKAGKKEAYAQWLNFHVQRNAAAAEADKMIREILSFKPAKPGKIDKDTFNIPFSESNWRRAAKNVQQQELKDQMDVIGKTLKDFNAFEKTLSAEDLALFRKTLKAGVEYRFARDKINLPAGVERPTGFSEFRGSSNIQADIISGMGNSRLLSIKFGDRGATLFKSLEAAHSSAISDMGLRAANVHIGKQGDGYYVEILKPLDVTNPNVRAQLALDVENKSPRPLITNQIVNWMRGSDAKRSRELSGDAKIAVYGSANLYDKIAKVYNQSIGKLDRFESKDFLKFLEYQRSYFDVATKETGKFSDNQFQLESMWRDVHGRFPNEAESKAYWTYIQIINLDKVLLDMGIYRDKTIQGMENFWFTLGGLNDAVPYIEGKMLGNLPHEASVQRNAGVVVFDGNPAAAKHMYYNDRGAKAEIDKLIAQGYKTVQLSHYGADDFKALGGMTNEIKGSRVNFVLTREVETAPLSFNQTGTKAGGHHVYQWEHYVRQPDIRNLTYYGDTTYRGFMTEREAKDFAKVMERGRELYLAEKAGNKSAARELDAFLAKNHPDSPKQFRNLFDNGTYNIDIPFLTTRQGQRAWDVHKLERYPGMSKVQDIVTDPLSLYQSTNLRFALERGEHLMTVRKSGTSLNPTYDTVPAPMVNPLTVMDRAIKHLANNMHMGDYQIKTTERFIAEFGHLLEGKESKLLNDPLNSMLNPIFKAGADQRELRAANNFRDAAMELLKVKNAPLRDWEFIQDKMASTLVSGIGHSKAQTVMESNLYKTLKHPLDATKSAVMHYALMSPRQLLVQAMGVSHVAAHVGYIRGLEAMAATIYGRVVRDYTGAKGMLEHAAEKLQISGWKRADFQEAYKIGDSTGYLTVNRSYALMDAMGQTPSIGTSAGRKVLDLGMTPFRWGEEFVRHTSWYASYREWKAANPNRAPTDFEVAGILNRADMMSGNMSQASMSSAQYTGLKIPTTFWSYNQRIWEQMLDMTPGSMTNAQKARVLWNYSVLFGAPTAAATVFFGVPVYEMAQDYLLKQGVPANNQDNFLLNLAMNGLIGAGVEAATGTQFNVSQNYGPSNSKIFVDIVSDKEGWELLLGATGTMFKDIYTNAQPFARFLVDMVAPPTDRDAFQINASHFQAWMNTQRGVDQVTRGIWALNYGELLSRTTGRELDDKINTVEAVIFGLTGMTPQRVQDAYGLVRNSNKLKEMQTAAIPGIERSYKAALTAIRDGDMDRAADHQRDIRIAFAMNRFTYDQQSVAIRRILSNNQSLTESVHARAGRGTPEGEKLYRAYQRLLEGRR